VAFLEQTKSLPLTELRLASPALNMPPNTALPNDCPIMREKNKLDIAAPR
jgi:hypothetical protein